MAATLADFAYEFRAVVQDPDEFLARRAGDCDDFAIVADQVLRQLGHQTRLVHVRLVGRVGHTVCYVAGSHGYLDYNNRRYLFKVTRSGSSLREIAEKVASSFEANWTSVSEFSFDAQTGGKTVVQTEVKIKAPPKVGEPTRGSRN